MENNGTSDVDSWHCHSKRLALLNGDSTVMVMEAMFIFCLCITGAVLGFGIILAYVMIKG